MIIRSKKIDGFNIINGIVLSIFCFICIYPMIYVIAGSFNSGIDYIKGGVYFFPRKFSLSNYITVFMDKRLISGLIVTVLRTVIGTAAGTLFTAMVAYAMARKDLVGRKFYYALNIFTMFFSGGLIPYFLVIKELNLINSFWVYIIPQLYSVFNMIVMQNFFSEVSVEMRESAYLDGAGEYTVFFKIYLNISIPAIATIGLWNTVFHWNSYFDSMLYTTKEELGTLQLFLMKLIKESSMPTDVTGGMPAGMMMDQPIHETIRLAAMVITIIPIAMVYPFVQKYFMKGLMLGSLKD